MATCEAWFLKDMIIFRFMAIGPFLQKQQIEYHIIWPGKFKAKVMAKV